MKPIIAFILVILSNFSHSYERILEVNPDNLRINIFNENIASAIPDIEKFQITLSHPNSQSEETSISRLKVIFSDHQPITIKNFNKDQNSTYSYSAYSPFLIFKNALFSVSYFNDLRQASVSISVNEGYTDQNHAPLFIDHSRSYTDVTKNPVADVAHGKVMGKKVTLKLRKYPMQVADDQEFQIPTPIYYLIDVSGHGIENFQLKVNSGLTSLNQITSKDIAISLNVSDILNESDNIENLWVETKIRKGDEYITTSQNVFPINLQP